MRVNETLHAALDPSLVGTGEIDPAHANDKALWRHTSENNRTKKNKTRNYRSAATMNFVLPVEAVGRRDDPLFRQQGSAALVKVTSPRFLLE